MIQPLQTTSVTKVHRSKNSTIDSPFVTPHSLSLSFHSYTKFFTLYLVAPLSFTTTLSKPSQLHPPLATSIPSLLSVYFPTLKFPATTTTPS